MNPTHNHATADVAQAWRDAALYLERHGWIQRSLYRIHDGEQFHPVPAACAIGALGMAIYGEPFDDVHTPDHPEAAFFNYVEGLFEDYLDLSGYLSTEPPHRGLGIGEWNDHPDRTAEQVIDLLRTAADEWDTYYGCGGAA
jgi:GNAT superfamily N-acetyltransferase